ncbi:Ferric reduction oxidase 8 protein [Thalictrum thalictroides]|uniref:Ferric reduction oxidase 8 protein n=1 Tax=Thalictrum thalictroides TaxID=46969 RepID=A0A7J6UUY4_THATH|nr:Ferric reduction oxidase 8 protein [Thalictrum thalictroides]
MKTTSALQTVLKVLMILISSGWVCLWLLKPTELWTKAWRKAEDGARNQIFGYQGLDFMVYSFPVISVAVIGFIYLSLRSKEQRSRQKKISITNLSNPVIVHGPLGVISGSEILAAVLFIIFLGWTMYAHISKDFNKMLPVKSLKLNIWQYKFMKLGTRFGLLAEACLALLLFPVARGMSIFRLIGLQFEVSIKYHIFLGTAMIFFATVHGLSTLFIWGIKHRLQDKIWIWQKTGRVYLAGEIALVTGLVIWITSLPQIRRKKFELFYYTHHLYIVFLVFFLFHVGDRHFYMVFSGILLFALDKLLRIIQTKPETCLLSACLLSSNAVELTLSKHPSLTYTPTSVIFLKVPSISKFQWHPFSITSSSSVDDEKVTVLVRSEGWWTNSLYNKILAAVDSGANQVKCLLISVEGPYGPVSTEFLRYDSLLLVAGGIGLTPFLSILQEIGSAENSTKSALPTRVQLIYAMKKSQDINLLKSILHILLKQSMNQLQLKVRIYVTQEKGADTTMREWLQEMPKVQTVNFDSKSLNYTTSGIESFLRMAAVAGLSSKIFLLALVCLNHMFHQQKGSSDKKNPSWVTDLILICSFSIATICSTLAIAILRMRKMNKDISPVYQNNSKDTEQNNIEASGTLEEHEVFYGQRPDFEDIFSKFPSQTGGSNIGVLVCGPESMKESVASIIKKNSPGFTIGAKRRQPCFNLHSLNFSL